MLFEQSLVERVSSIILQFLYKLFPFEYLVDDLHSISVFLFFLLLYPLFWGQWCVSCQEEIVISFCVNMQTNTKIVMAVFILLQCHLRVLLLASWVGPAEHFKRMGGICVAGEVQVQLHKGDRYPLAVTATVTGMGQQWSQKIRVGCSIIVLRLFGMVLPCGSCVLLLFLSLAQVAKLRFVSWSQAFQCQGLLDLLCLL